MCVCLITFISLNLNKQINSSPYILNRLDKLVGKILWQMLKFFSVLRPETAGKPHIHFQYVRILENLKKKIFYNKMWKYNSSEVTLETYTYCVDGLPSEVSMLTS